MKYFFFIIAITCAFAKDIDEGDIYDNVDDVQNDVNLKLRKSGNLVRNNHVATISNWHKEWRVSFNIAPLSTTSGWSNILHFTTGGNCCKNGQRIPAIWFFSNTFRLLIVSSLNNQGNAWKPMSMKAGTQLPPWKFTHVVVAQVLYNGKYYVRVYVGSQSICFVENKHPKAYKNVKVYLSDPWYKPANAIVKDFRFHSTPAPVVGNIEKGHLFATIPVWRKKWRVSFQIKPLTKTFGWSNILHFTTGGNCCKNGQRIPGIWFFSKTFRMLIVHSLNNQGNAWQPMSMKSGTELPALKFTRVVVEQIFQLGKYYVRVYIGGKPICFVHNKAPRAFKNVKVYLGSPWWKPSVAIVKEFTFHSTR